MKHLLIIAHEDHTRDNLASYSEKLGFKPITIADPLACNAAKTDVKKCNEGKPCAGFLLVDKDCPSLDGLSLIELQMLKGCSVNKKHKALIASELSNEESEKADLLGCHVISKPVAFHDLESWLKCL